MDKTDKTDKTELFDLAQYQESLGRPNVVDPGGFPTSDHMLFGFLITPPVAKEWLAHSPGNRRIHINLIEKYARQYRAGQWMVNGEAIIFDRNGHLRNGHHRLLACIQTGLAFRSDVRFGIDPEAYKTIDSGGVRTVGDNLSIRYPNLKDTNMLGTATANVMSYLDGNYGSLGKGGRYSKLDVDAAFDVHFDITGQSLTLGRRLRSLCAAATSVAMHYLASRVQPAKADEFWQLLHDGNIAEIHNPALVLRNRLQRDRSPQTASRHAMKTPEICALFGKAFNAFVAGREITILKWMRDGKNMEEFPAIEGVHEWWERKRRVTGTGGGGIPIPVRRGTGAPETPAAIHR